jgi:hypothetical protein
MRQLHAGAQRHLHEMRYVRKRHRMQLGSINRNTLVLIVGALAIVVAVLGNQLYQDQDRK